MLDYEVQTGVKLADEVTTHTKKAGLPLTCP